MKIPIYTYYVMYRVMGVCIYVWYFVICPFNIDLILKIRYFLIYF